ncbi:integrase catalytic domain-containing protein [Trichonephila clavipes]|nr:integrase catalytic domain-containing protein [Trichonephila clavipes]
MKRNCLTRRESLCSFPSGNDWTVHSVVLYHWKNPLLENMINSEIIQFHQHSYAAIHILQGEYDELWNYSIPSAFILCRENRMNSGIIQFHQHSYAPSLKTPSGDKLRQKKIFTLTDLTILKSCLLDERRAYLGCCGNGGLEIPSKAKIIDLKKLIESSAVYKNDIEFVRSLVENALEKSKQEAEKNEREAEKNKREAEKYKREAKIQLEKIKLSQIEKQLELEKVRKESEKNSQSLESGEPSSITDKLESLVKSIKTLTIQVPVRSESFNLFFHSLEKAFQIKSVPDELKAEILLNILGERVNNLLTYVSQEDLSNYAKIKELILREFEPTPQECLSNFKKARKLPSENYVQFASRLSATFDYYCQLRKVNEFRSLCDLIISDKIFEMLDRDTMNHIATKQGETYFKPQQLGRECDVYLSARGKVSNDLMSRNPGSGVKTDGRYRLQTVSTWRQERNSSNVFVAETKTNCVLCKGNNFHPFSKCYQFKKLSVEDRVEVVKRNNLCFRCFLPHRLKECRSEKNCFCLRPHNSLIHFSRDKTRNPTPTSNLNLDAPTFVPG